MSKIYKNTVISGQLTRLSMAKRGWRAFGVTSEKYSLRGWLGVA